MEKSNYNSDLDDINNDSNDEKNFSSTNVNEERQSRILQKQISK